MMNKILSIARAKLKYYKGLNQLGACLTPAEIHALVDDGYKPAGYRVVPAINDPKPLARWFYFSVKKGEFYQEK